MKRKYWLAVLFIAIIILVFYSSRIISSDHRPSPDNSNVVALDVIIRQGDFDPDVIIVYQGDFVRLSVKSIDVEQNIIVDGYNIDIDIKPNEHKTVEFLADQVGEFDIYGSLDDKLKGKLIVNLAQ